MLIKPYDIFAIFGEIIFLSQLENFLQKNSSPFYFHITKRFETDEKRVSSQMA